MRLERVAIGGDGWGSNVAKGAGAESEAVARATAMAGTAHRDGAVRVRGYTAQTD